MPVWVMWERYAAEHGMEDAARVPERVNARTYARWLLLRRADNARLAAQHAERAENWTQDLTASERELILWARGEDDE